MEREEESVYLMDLGACLPADVISDEPTLGRWTAVAYSTAIGCGRMLFAGPGTAAPPVRLSLPVAGWHHLFVATYRSPQQPETCLLVKLASDPAYTRAATEGFRPEKDLVSPAMLPLPTDLTEAYWKTACLAPGEEVVFHRPGAGSMSEAVANVAYLRMVPLSAAEEAHASAERGRRDTRRLIANYDGGQHLMWAYGSLPEMQDEFQALAGSDFGIVLWGTAYSLATFYPSRVASEVRWAFGMPGVARTGAEAKAHRRCHDFDPLAAAVTCARGAGVAIYPQVRMEGEQWPPNHQEYGGPGAFQRLHPEWRCLTTAGEKTRHLSQAFPEVRAQYVALFREWVEAYDADGVCIVFCRSWPYVLCETPVRESFRQLHGIEMTALDRFDPRVLSHQASFLTTLLRQTRAMLDEVGQRRGQYLGTCYVVPASGYVPSGCPDLGPFTTPWSRAMDVPAWVNEGLVDHLVVHIEQVGTADGSDSQSLLAPYVELARGTGTRVYADLYPRRQSADSMRLRALACYQAGVDGLCFWDSHDRATRLSGWAMHRLLGHREELPGMREFAQRLFRRVPLTSLGGFVVQDEDCLPTDG